MLKITVGVLYSVVVSLLVIYAIHLLTLIFLYLRHKSAQLQPISDLNPEDFPHVLIQIPLRNERYVVSNVLNAVAQLDWPSDKLHIQVLDDSDDETYDQAVSVVSNLQKKGYRISMIHRVDNLGFKAGALIVGLTYSNCDYIAIFDADFYPDSQFLKKTVPHLINDPNLAMVQTRWSYANTSDSFVTQSQAIALDGHFIIDQIARNRSKLLMNFNGTAGVWRRCAIQSAGGWQTDTLAEDLDLSYRAQLAGWKCLYLPDVSSLSQLPNNVQAFKQQQSRWAKGASQTLRKLALPIIRSKLLTFGQKLMALLHLSGYITQLLFILLVFLSLPMTLLYATPPSISKVLGPIAIIPLMYYGLSQLALYPNWVIRSFSYPQLALLAISCSFDTTLALLDGFVHWGGVFIRTPKVNLNDELPRTDPIYVEQGNTHRLRSVLQMLPLVYIIVSVTTAMYVNVTHYILPGIMYMLSQILYIYTGYREKKKTREK